MCLGRCYSNWPQRVLQWIVGTWAQSQSARVSETQTDSGWGSGVSWQWNVREHLSHTYIHDTSISLWNHSQTFNREMKGWIHHVKMMFCLHVWFCSLLSVVWKPVFTWIETFDGWFYSKCYKSAEMFLKPLRFLNLTKCIPP